MLDGTVVATGEKVAVAIDITEAMRERATRAIYEVTAGGVPFGKSRRRGRKPAATVSASLLAEVALEAAFREEDS